MDAITLLKADHKKVAKLFREYKAAHKAGRSDRTKIVAITHMSNMLGTVS